MTDSHVTIADQFMAHKGYPDARPYDIEKIDGEPCWYFLYKLDEGTLELEVYWDGESWSAMVTTFNLAG